MKHKQLMQLLTLLHSMILVLALLTPFTPSISVQLFNHFRIAQTRLMVLHVLHSPKTNTKLRSILQAAALHPDLWSGHTDAHPNFAQAFSNTRTIPIFGLAITPIFFRSSTSDLRNRTF